MTEDVRHVHVDIGAATVHAAVGGDGPAIMLLHGFPHTHELWSAITPDLRRTRRVVAVDLRGLGASSRATTGYDAITLAGDLLAVLDELEIDRADVVAIDAGVPPAFVLGLQHPDRVRRLVLVESTLGTLPGADEFFRGGPPWWFGFHAVPGLAETVLEGHEADYLDFFYRTGTHDGRGIDRGVRDRFVAAYSGRESLRCGFEYYRAMPETSRQLAALVADRRLVVPTLAVGAHPVGAALAGQLASVADDVRGELISDCGHIVPLDRPAQLLALLDAFLD